MENGTDYDAIVIGSGIGGLAAAAVLARLKHFRVLVLEQHFKLGGFTHTFQRPGGYEWDVGLHYVGEMNPGNPLRRVMDFMTGGQVDWIPMKDPFEVFLYPGLKFEVPTGRKNHLRKLQEHFPREARSLRRYFRDLDLAANSLHRSMPSRALKRGGFIQHCRQMALGSLRTYLESHFQDLRLKGLLASQWGDYGLPPKLACFGLHAVIVKHYLEGGYYPLGSPSRLAQAAVRVVEAEGGTFRVRHRVRRILVENGRAVGVEVENNKGVETIKAPEIYSDAGAEATYGKLLSGNGVDPDELKELSAAQGYGVVTLYLGLRSRCETLGIHGQNFWIYDDFDHDSVWGRRNRLAEGRASSCYLSFPGLKNPLAKRPTAEIIAPLDHHLFQDWKGKSWMRRGPEYQALKEKITEALLTFVENHIPGFRGEVVTAELSTPLSVEHFMGHRDGAIYGFPGTAKRYGLRSLKPKTPVKGLTLVGADAGSLGVAGAMMGGVMGVAAQHGSGILSQIFKTADTTNESGARI